MLTVEPELGRSALADAQQRLRDGRRELRSLATPHLLERLLAFIFRGRVGRKSRKPGDYRLNGKATDNAGNVSPLKRKGFEILP